MYPLKSRTSVAATRCLVIWLSATAVLVAAPLEIADRLEPLWDDYLIDRLDDVELRLWRPTDAGPVLAFDRPWEGPFCGYATVIHDAGRYQLYYRGLPEAGADGSNREVTCYAESADGIRWNKPELGFFAWQGSKANNIILADHAPASHNFCPFLDKNPQVAPAERFKALGGTADSGLIGFVSADGIRWNRVRQAPIFRDEGWVFDSQNVCFWSAWERQYVLYYRRSPHQIRAIARSTSPDFITWSTPVMMTYSDTGSDRPAHHLYTNQTHPYYRAPHIYVSTAARFLPDRQVLTDDEAHAIHVHPRYFHDTSDAVLMTTRDGLQYRRTHLAALIRPAIGARNWVSRTNYPALNIVGTGELEMSLYVNQDYGQPTAHLRRYVYRPDGLSSVSAGASGGQLITKPIAFTGRELVINFATSAAGSIRVELQDESGQALPNFTLSQSRELIGNELERIVSWDGRSDVSSLAGTSVRIRFQLVDADLYSLRFRNR